MLRLAHDKRASKTSPCWSRRLRSRLRRRWPLAQTRGPPILRDTEAEQLLRDYTRPILRAAGLEKQNIQMVIINEGSFNAFVADGRRIFVNYGAIMQSETPNQIIGVLAHETGHLAGGHLAKLREQLANAQTQMIIAMLLGAGAMVAGSRGGNATSGLAQAGAAAMSAPQEMIKRTLLAYVRQHEESRRQGRREIPHRHRPVGQAACTRPSSASPMRACSPRAAPIPICSRIRCRPIASQALEELARSSPYWDKKDDPALQLRHDMVRAKTSAFMERPETVYRRYPQLQHQPAGALCPRHRQSYRHGDLRVALAQIDHVDRRSSPPNPYFYELRGQALLEGGKPVEAIAPLRKAVQLSN